MERSNKLYSFVTFNYIFPVEIKYIRVICLELLGEIARICYLLEVTNDWEKEQ